MFLVLAQEGRKDILWIIYGYHLNFQIIFLLNENCNSDIFKMNQEGLIQATVEEVKEEKQSLEEVSNGIQTPSVTLPLRHLKDHWLTISRPQYERTCGISSLVSIWNYQFSRLGLGTKEPICIEQAMLKLNLIGKGSIGQSLKKKYKKINQLTQNAQKTQANSKLEQNKVNQNEFNDTNLRDYISSIDFGYFTGNDTLLRWYRLLCRIYGGSGRAYYFYKVNSDRSLYKDESNAKKGLVEGLNKDNLCFIYHAHDHYFCPVGYEFIPKQQSESETFQADQLNQEGSELYIMVGQSSKMFAGIHVFKWSEIQLDLSTFWPKYFNIRRRKQGVRMREGKQNQVPNTATIDCIMAFEKIKD